MMALESPRSGNAFKQRLASGQKQPGLWLGLDSPAATEILAGSGYAWLLLDLEHSCIDISAVPHHLRAATGGSAELVVRVPANEPVVFKRLLDAGVRSFMVPMVQSPEDARAAVAATRYPPQGIRGVAGMTRATRYGRTPDYMQRAHLDICIVAQLESAAAITDADRIGAVEGIDAVFVGPNDLAANIGKLGQPGCQEVQDLIEVALMKSRKIGSAAGILNFKPGDARDLFERGYSFIAVGSDAGILARRSEALLEELRLP
jgi:4-hydroxy-2-oxoheptanedioate aldolase